MQRVCLVVHRYGKEIVGGSEQLARCYAHLLKRDYDVHVVTSCAADHITWRNEYEPGLSDDDGVAVHRFPVDFERSEFWHQLHYALLLEPVIAAAFRSAAGADWTQAWSVPGAKEALAQTVERSPIGIQEEFIRRQGPYSTPLLNFLSSERDNIDTFLFFTYLYPTTYFGSKCVPRVKSIICPTLHDEPPAYLPVFHTMMQSFARTIYLSEGERMVAKAVCEVENDGDVIGMPIEPSVESAAGVRVPAGRYLAYCGRIEGAKGSATMFDYFSQYKQDHPGDLKLVLIGHAVSEIPKRPDVEYLGYATEEQKLAIMQNATALIQPSPFESFSIVLLESFFCGTPAIVNGNCSVLREHCLASSAGFAYTDYEQFAEAVTRFKSDPELRDRMGANGKNYVRENYATDVVTAKLKAIINAEPRDEVSVATTVAAVTQTVAAGSAISEGQRVAVPTRTEPARFRIETPPPHAAPIPRREPPIPRIPEDLSFRSAHLPERSLEALRGYLSESIVTAEARAELLGYVQEASQRFVFTMCLVPNRSGTLLELGANPYFLTLLLKRMRSYELELANFFSEHLAYDVNGISEQQIVNTKFDERHHFRFRTFNIEKDRFPYGDASFDVVLFCEIIEHLTADPVAALEQIHRVLKPGGHLVLTTPNVARRENVHRLAHGNNIYDPYSRYGMYGRHNREYNVSELSSLAAGVGFEVEKIATQDVHGDWDCGIPNCKLRPKSVDGGGGQYIFMRARKVSSGAVERPAWLYR